MASLPEDDGPTMSGLPEDRRIDRPPPPQPTVVDDEDGDDDEDTTTAEAGPPAPRPTDLGATPAMGSPDADPAEPAGHEADDSTVQQKVSPPLPPRKPTSTPSSPVAPPVVPAALLGTLVSPAGVNVLAATVKTRSPSDAVISVGPSTQPLGTAAASPITANAGASSVAAPPTAPSPVRPPSGSTTEAEALREEELEEDDLEEVDDEEKEDEDGEPLEDSVTTTAPRIDAASLMEAANAIAGLATPDMGIPSSVSARLGNALPLTVPGAVQIRSVDPEDMLDETEVRTRPGYAPLNIPASLKGLAPPGPAPSQPPPPVRPAAGRPPSIVAATESSSSLEDDDDDEQDDGVTTEAQAPKSGELDELAAMMTLSSKSLAGAAAPSASLLISAVASTEPSPDLADDPIDPPTRPGVEGAALPPTRPGVASAENDPPTRPGLEPPTRPGLGLPAEPETAKRSLPIPGSAAIPTSASGYPNDDDDDGDIVTTRGPAPSYTASSTTSQAPRSSQRVPAVARASSPDLDDGTDGTTQKVRRTAIIKPPASLAAGGAESPADGESESITTQAPGPLTNILRVIASGSSPDLEDSGARPPVLESDEEPPENRTAVMANAPLKRVIAEVIAANSASSLPAIRPTGGPLVHGPQGSLAPQLEPSSESGLRTRSSGSGNHRSSGIVANAMASDGSVSAPIDIRALAATEMAFPNSESGQPSVHDVDLGKGPRYGLLVAVVAVISVIVPVTLYFALRHGPDAPTAAEPSEPASEVQTTGPLRTKAGRNRNGSYVVPSATPSASASSGPRTGTRH